MSGRITEPVGRPPASPWPFVGMAGMAVVFFPYAASGLLAPPWAVALLLALWVAGLVLACRWWTRRPRLVLAVPVALVVVWFAVLNLGAALWGWSA